MYGTPLRLCKRSQVDSGIDLGAFTEPCWSQITQNPPKIASFMAELSIQQANLQLRCGPKLP